VCYGTGKPTDGKGPEATHGTARGLTASRPLDLAPARSVPHGVDPVTELAPRWRASPERDGLYWVCERAGPVTLVDVRRGEVWTLGSEAWSPVHAYSDALWRRVVIPPPPARPGDVPRGTEGHHD
jgi:hypothetical protein